MAGIGMMEFRDKVAELTNLGVNKETDIIMARLNRDGCPRLQGFKLYNRGNGAVTFTLKKRGASTTVAAENIDALRVGATDRFRGSMANRRVTPGTVKIVDSNVGTPQQVEDTNGDGVLYQTNGPAGPSYPVEVGAINYNEGIIDLTFEIGVTLSVTADYKHKNWADFATPITFDVVAGGAVPYEIGGDKTRSENFQDGIGLDTTEIGFAAKKKSGEVSTTLALEVLYYGDDSLIKLPIKKGEIDDYPYHNA